MDSDSSDNPIEGVVMMDMIPQDSDDAFSDSSESELEPQMPDETAEMNDYLTYDPELTRYHLYMGNMECVTGMRYYDQQSTVRLYYTFLNSIVYPGEILPMLFSTNEASADSFGNDPIGLVFVEGSLLKGYGVTGQVIEKRVSHDHGIRAKIRVLQRFKLVTPLATHPYEIHLLPHYSPDIHVDVEILPEFQLGPPVSTLNQALAANRWAPNKSQVNKMKKIRAMTLPWPNFVYNMYDIQRIMMKIQYFAMELRIHNMPEDPRQSSFWSARNLPLEDTEQAKIFKSNFVESRMMIIEKSLNEPYAYLCRTCRQKIANFKDVIPMTKDGIQAAYCNKNGFIHETVTVSSIEEDTLAIEDQASTRQSWFPGYSWRIAYCGGCSRHKGWKFTAVRKELTPPFFYGLSRIGVILSKF